ncbi:hypothetical protein Val02_49990 [Virgisporangium aliadipatigenens]|uniref:Uncharacterized protein n=1 Tax=Virgisporangium aliadipatigenens TaxID=741659 RepID=A0A8J3YQU1_9ACTN|nr:hypothetical protein Val02_49990 [Virgisporangium aliadipatigenens]
MGRQLFQSTTATSDIALRLLRLEERVMLLEAALARLAAETTTPPEVRLGDEPADGGARDGR